MTLRTAGDTGFTISIAGKKLIEANQEPLTVGSVLESRWQPNRLMMQLLERFKKWPVPLCHEPIRDVKPVVGINADQVCVESGMVQLRQIASVSV